MPLHVQAVPTTSGSRAFRFGVFELQPEERRLLASGARIHLGPHAFDVLVVLVERTGHLVSKDELLRLVWPKAVVEENTLQVHISALRKALGPGAIATVAGRGYRFELGVTQVAAAQTLPSPPPKHNLPHEFTSFIGREKEIAELTELLAGTRLLTLTGSGGCGKTRLATQLARQHVHAYPDGTWLVELAALTDAALLSQAVATVLNIKERSGAPLIDTIAQYLAARSALLVLDNAEHLLEPCAQLADSLLRRCERVVIVVTSRERLRITGELIYRVPALSVPEEQDDATPESIAAYESARLFIDRARLQLPHFAITTQNCGAIASLCRRLDGVALALELAAPRMRTLSVEELSRHVDRRFELLTDGSRTALPRHRTLRALIDWSYELLGDAEKAILRRVSIFSGGWTLAAAEHVCGGDLIDAVNVLEMLTSLADKNLVSAEPLSEGTRYALLETMRHYARDRLHESGEESRTQRLHMAYFLSMAEEADRQLREADDTAWLDRLERQRDNLRSALSWSLSERGDAAAGLRLAGALSYFWWRRGYLREGRDWLSRLLEASPKDEQLETRAKACHAAAILAQVADDYPASQHLHEEALAIRKQLGDRHGIGRTLANLGTVAASRGDYGSAQATYEEAVTIFREVGDLRNVAATLANLGTMAMERGDYAAARGFLEESLAIGPHEGGWSTAHALNSLGIVAHAQGDDAAALKMLEQALAIARKEQTPSAISMALRGMARVEGDRGNYDSACTLLKEALSMQREGGSRDEVAQILERFAAVVSELAGPFAAARIWGAAERSRDEIGSPIPPAERTWYDRQVAAARAALGDEAAFDAVWNEGRAMNLDQVVAYAMAFDVGTK